MPIGVFPIEPVDVKATVPSSVTIDGGSLGVSGDGPTVFNVDMAVAGEEYSQLLPSGTKSFEIRARNRSTLQFAYSPGSSSSAFVRVAAGSSYTKDLLNMTGLTIYFQSTAADEVAEITAWV